MRKTSVWMRGGMMMVLAAGLAVGGCEQSSPTPKSAPKSTPPANAPAPATGTPAANTPAEKSGPAPHAASASVLDRTMNLIDGTPKNLADYKGKVVMVVNVASQCGNTPQYKELEALYESKKDQGLVVLGFPANDFNGQEPGSNKDISEFCTKEYHITFPMFEKISVKGDGQHAFYKELAAQPAPVGGDPTWNFQKFVIDRKGNVVARFNPKTQPNDPEVVKKIDELLKS